MNKERINFLISNWNFVNLLFGFSFVTILFLDNGESMISTNITMPYRLVSLILSILVIFNNLGNYKKITILANVFVLFYLAYILKIIFCLNFDTFVYYGKSDITYYSFSILIVFIPLISVLLSSTKLDINFILKNSFLIVFVSSILATLGYNPANQMSIEKRLDANVALSSISFGHLGVSLVILAFAVFRKSNYYNILAILSIFLGLFIIIIAGSRSPFLALIIIVGVFILQSKLNKVVLYTTIVSFLSTICIFLEHILTFINLYSQVSYSRLSASVENGDTGDRDSYYKAAIEQFFESPFIGGNFVLINGLGKGDYPHNLFLEALMAFGILGGLVVFIFHFRVFYVSQAVISFDRNYRFLFLLFLQFLVVSSLHGSWWGSTSFVFILGYFLNLKQNRLFAQSIYSITRTAV